MCSGVQCRVQFLLQRDVDGAQAGDPLPLPHRHELHQPLRAVHDPRQPGAGEPTLAPKHLHLQPENFQGINSLNCLGKVQKRKKV